MEELAKFHALSLAYSERYPEDFRTTINEIPREGGLEGDFGTLIQDITNIVQDEDKESFCNVLKGLDTISVFKKWHSKGGREFISHGDFRITNLMNRVKEGKQELALVDFQFMHCGSPVTDIIFFMLTSTDKKFRDEHFENLFDHYYRHLGLKLKLLNLNVDSLYPREMFDKEIKDYLPLSVIIPLYYWPFIYADDDHVPLRGEDITLEKRKLKLSEKFVKAFSGIVTEWRKWNII